MRPSGSSLRSAKSCAGLRGASVMDGSPASLPSAARLIW